MSSGYIHAQLGEFRPGLEAGRDFECDWEWCGKPTELHINNEGGSLDEAVSHALAFKSKELLWDAEIRDQIFARYYQIWNDSWREDEAELEKPEWLAHFTLESFEFSPDGYFTAWFKDGDLFWGHSMEVCGKVDEGVKSVTMMG